VRITSAKTFTVGNPWKNWVFVRLETDEGVYGVGEGTANAFAETIATAIHELEDTYVGLDPTQVELLAERMHRDVYTDGGQIHRAALAAIEIACWDILGKSVGKPVHALMGGRVRDRVRVYANGWYQVERTPEAMAAAARGVAAKGYTALKFDPFGAGYYELERDERRRPLRTGVRLRGPADGHDQWGRRAGALCGSFSELRRLGPGQRRPAAHFAWQRRGQRDCDGGRAHLERGDDQHSMTIRLLTGRLAAQRPLDILELTGCVFVVRVAGEFQLELRCRAG